MFVLSAADDAGLNALAARHLDALGANPDVAVADLCWNAATTRPHLAHRVAISCADLDELTSGLSSFLAGQPAGNVRAGRPGSVARPMVGFAFTGQGARYAGAGAELYRTSPVFRAALDDCAEAFTGLIDRPLLAMLQVGEASPSNADLAGESDETPAPTKHAQPALFALEYALAALWRSWGVAPGVVFGHSLGEVAAACVAGVLELPDAARFVAARGALMGQMPPGAMASVNLASSTLETLLADSDAEIAGYNGPDNVVVTGPAASVDAVCAAVDAAGGRHTRLEVDHAFHSRATDSVLPDFVAAIDGLPFQPPHDPLISNVTGASASTELADPKYWANHMRQPVQFERCVQTAADMGVTHLIEIGPAPLLLGMVAPITNLPADNLLPSLRPSSADWNTMLQALQSLYVAGVDVDWHGFDAHAKRQRIALPTYPFQRRRFWFDVSESTPSTGDPDHLWSSISTTLERNAGLGPVDVDLTGYDEKFAALERLTVAAAGDVLVSARIFTTAGDSATIAQVRDRLGASDAYDHLLARWLERLADGGDLHRVDDTFVAATPLAGDRSPRILAEVETHLAGDPYFLDYVRHCASLLPAVIRGDESPLTTLFPNGSFALAEGIYQRSVTARYINQLAASLVQAMVSASSSRRALRVLEIGAGTGGTTAALLPLLAPGRTDYFFTDVSDLFLDRARLTLGAYPFVRFGLFDLEGDTGEQGLEPGSFDLIVSANAVHATTDLRHSLRSIHDLLAPGGVLALVETTEHLAWFDMTTGLIEGWQAFDDDLRDDNPLLPAPTWLEALGAAGFVRQDAWPRPDTPTAALSQHLIVAQKEGVAPMTGHSGFATADSVPGAPGQLEAELSSEWLDRLDEVPSAERIDVVEELVRTQVMTILGLADDQAPAPQDGLLDLGFDSLMAVNLSGRLSILLALPEELPSTLVFDHPSIRAIASFVLAALDGDAPAPGEANPTNPPARAQVDDGLATEVAAMSDAEIEASLRERFTDT